jgi:hypothetical protein
MEFDEAQFRPKEEFRVDYHFPRTVFCISSFTQGVALGYVIMPFQGKPPGILSALSFIQMEPITPEPYENAQRKNHIDPNEIP